MGNENDGNREKGILRKSLEGMLPDEVFYRKKSPYPKTHHPAYLKIVKGMLESALQDRQSVLYEFFDQEKLLQIS